jgi:hypothetical protein
MPEIKNTFQSGIMNKDLDERLVPNGQFRDAMNVQVATSEESSVGTVQNILGNSRFEDVVTGEEFKCVGGIADEKNNCLYWFVTSPTVDAIIEYHDNTTVTPILVDTFVGTDKAVLKFDSQNLITGINIIDNLLFWTDNSNEPRKINIDTFKLNSTINNYNTLANHSLMFVNNVSVGNVTEDHITVIRKRPQKAPSVVFSDSTLQDIYTLEDINFNGLNTASPTVTNIFFESTSPVAPYVVGDILLLSNASTVGTLPQNFVIKIQVVGIFSVTNGYEINFDITYIEGTFVDEDANYNCIKEIDTKPIFEKEFIRFATRYKYADGEYSAFSPFTQPVFLAGRFGFHPTKDPYNLGMENNSISIRLEDLVPTDTPDDVTQIDILFKKERSTTIYSIDSIKPNDPVPDFWNDNAYAVRTVLPNTYNPGTQAAGSAQHTSHTYGYSGQYDITVENIYAALPENQMLRPWDNVPRKALAQEITSNRIIYANYLQNYNLKDFNGDIVKPYINISYADRIDHNGEQVNLGINLGKKSIKSLRTYYAGVVYGDKYGRETPVFTSKDASVKIPYDQDDTNNFDGTADKSLRFKVSLFGNIPSFAYYYKYFIKQTTGEYYNLTMDRVYKSDADENLWISFPSSDRNKIQEGDYFSIKKQVDIESIIPVENKIKIIDIKNEAPDNIKFEFSNLGSVSGDAADLLLAFPDPNRRPAAGVAKILISQDHWVDVANGLDLESATTKSDKIAVQFSISQAGEILRSKKYLASAWAMEPASPTTSNYSIQLVNKISDEDFWIESSPGTLNDAAAFTMNVFKVIDKDVAEFEGRFFVKIISNPVTQQYLIPSTSDVIDYSTTARMEAFNFADVCLGNVQAGDGLVNNVNTTFGANLTGFTQTDTVAEWDSLTNGINAIYGYDSYWFIDAAFFIAGQSSNSTKVTDSGKLFKGNPTSPVQRVKGNEGVVAITNQPTHVKYGTTASRQWNVDEINPINTGWSTPDGSGANLSSNTWQYTSTGSYDGSYNTSENPSYYLHLSFQAPGVDLHNGNFNNLDNAIDNLYNTWISGFSGAGPIKIWETIFEHGLDRIPADNIIQPEPKGINFFSGNPVYGGTYQFNVSVPTSAGYASLDFNKWKYITHAPSIHPNLNNTDAVNAFNIGNNNVGAGAIAAKLVAGSKFMIEGDDSTVYTILDSHSHNLYNHTAWNPVQRFDASGNFIPPTSQTYRSVAYAMADFVDQYGLSSFPNSSNAEYSNLKSAIENFGKANNRRVSYVIELDQDPRNGLVDILSATKTSDLQLRFVESYIEPGANTLPTSPAIFETEAKEDQDLNIYYEASDAIPTKLNTDIDSLEGHLLGPVGSKVTCVANNFTPTVQQDEFPEFDFFPRVVGWQGNIVEINNPGFRDMYEPFNYSDQLGSFQNKIVKFWKKDGSWNSGKIIDIEITNEYITKLTINQNVNTLASTLPYFNCFSFGNGVESNRIRDDFNESFILNGVKASTVLEEPYEEERRKHSLIYSGLYNSTSGINNLNQFIQAEKITKDVMPSYGSIQKLYARDKDLVTLCEDKILQIFVDKDVLYNADGNPNLLSTDRVLGQANPFRGNFGISKNPESFASESFRAYFTDKQRGAVIRLSIDGLTPISDAGMHDYFRDNLKDGGRLYGSYDSHKEDYNLSIYFEDGEDNVLNPEFDEGFVRQFNPSGTELLFNPSFANVTSVFNTPTVIADGMFVSNASYSSKWSPSNPGSMQWDVANAPQNISRTNIDGIINSSASYSNPNYTASIGTGSVRWHGQISPGYYITQDVYSPTTTIGDEVKINWDFFNMVSNGAYSGGNKIRITFLDKNGNGFQIGYNELKYHLTPPNVTETHYEFTKTVVAGFNPNGDKPTSIGFWRIKMELMPTAGTPWVNKEFKLDNLEVFVPTTTTDDWTTNTLVVNSNGTLIFQDGGIATQIQQNYLFDSQKTYRVECVLSTPLGPQQNARIDLNGQPINTAGTGAGGGIGTFQQSGIITSDINFNASTSTIELHVTGGAIKIESISIQEVVPVGGNVDHWNLNLTGNTYMSGDETNLYTAQDTFSLNKKIVFDDAPGESLTSVASSAVLGVYLHQTLRPTLRALDFNDGVKCNVRFKLSNYTGGELTFRLYNNDGEGFEHTVDTSTNGVKTFSGTIGTLVNPSGAPFSFTNGFFGFYSSDPSNNLSCEIDSVSLIIDGEGAGTTISFNEKSKGWTSFKSFVPEFAISCVNQYYTMNLGQLWKHHVEFEIDNTTTVDRNTFYGIGPDQDVNAESSVTPILNKFPEVVKHFNTLNYEGTQSRVDEFTTIAQGGVNWTDGGYYNLQEQKGWYVHSIITNKQEGTVKEFIEKEGKWFNYIKGTDLETPDISAFNFQGLGVVETVTLPPPPPPLVLMGCTDPTALNYNPSVSIDDGSCIYN